jgi:hypothetical protein
MDSFQAFKYYIAVKLHFTTDNYNVFKNKGITKATRESFYKRKDCNLFERLSSKFKEPKDLIQHYVANFAYGNHNVIYTQDESEYNYKIWIKNKQSISKVFKDDLDTILNVCTSESKFELFSSQSDPILFKLYVSGKVNIETLCILDTFLQFISKWKVSHMKFLWEDDIRRIEKASGFIKYDQERITEIYKEFKSELDKL